MEDTRQDFSQLGFAKIVVLPALLLFLIPVISLLFFQHALSGYNDDVRDSLLEQIRTDDGLSEKEREEAIEFYTTNSYSELLKSPEFAENVELDVRFYFATLGWMIWLSVACIASGVGVFLLAGLCFLPSVRSRGTQSLGSSPRWRVLRILSALQFFLQGVLLVAMSYWVTALWFNARYPELIYLIGILAVVAVALAFRAVFKKLEDEFAVRG